MSGRELELAPFMVNATNVFASTFEEHQRNVVKWRQIKAQQMAAGER